MRITFRSACLNTLVVAVIYYVFLSVGTENFDLFGWYGIGWTGGDWLWFLALVGFFAFILFAEWRRQLKNERERQ